MTQDLGAAQPLVDAMRAGEKHVNPVEWLRSALAARQSAPRQDTSWHDEMVRRANASFLPPRTPPRTPPKTAARTTGAAASAAPSPTKRTPKRTPPRAAKRR
jgi:hypothetical protein